MTLTLRLNDSQTMLVDSLKEMFFQKRATTAIFQAIEYVVNHKEINEKKIETLSDRLDQALSNGEEIKLLLDHIKKTGY